MSGILDDDSLIGNGSPDEVRTELGLAGHAGVAPTEAEVALFRDLGGGDPVTLTAGGTRPADPGPGTMTVGVTGGNSAVRGESNKILINVAGVSGANIFGGIHTSVNYSIAAGLTLVVRLIPGATTGVENQTVATFVGFCTSTSSMLWTRGMIGILSKHGSRDLDILISNGGSSSDNASYAVQSACCRPGEEIALAVHHKSLTRQEYYIQGGQVASLGCELGSENWFLLGTTSVDMTGLSGYATVFGQRSPQTIIVDSVEVFSSWSPSPRAKTFDWARNVNGVHCPDLEFDPVTGLLVHMWNYGTTHVNADTHIRASVRLADWSWTTETTVIPAQGGTTNISLCSLSKVNGVLKLVTWLYPTASDGGVLRWWTVSVNPTTGVITLGPETVLSGLDTGSRKLNFSHIVTAADGALLIPYHKGAELTAGMFVGRSVDDGATWSEIQVSAVPSGQGITVLWEGSIDRESGSALGCYMRTDGGSTFYSRSTNDGKTWSVATKIAAIPNPNSRCIFRRLSNGRMFVIGNDSLISSSPNTFKARRNICIWEVGDNGKVLGKRPVGNWGRDTAPNNGENILQYPVFVEDGDNLVISFSNQPTGGATGSVCIRLHELRWGDPLPPEVGGVPLKDREPKIPFRKPDYETQIIPFSTSPTMDVSNGANGVITLTDSTATMGAPTGMLLPWQRVKYRVIQGTGGNFTMAWDAFFQHNDRSTTLQTAEGACDIFEFEWNPHTNKLVRLSA